MDATQLPDFKPVNMFCIFLELENNITIKKFNGKDPTTGTYNFVNIERKKNDVIYYYNPSIDNPQYSNLAELKKKVFS